MILTYIEFNIQLLVISRNDNIFLFYHAYFILGISHLLVDIVRLKLFGYNYSTFMSYLAGKSEFGSSFSGWFYYVHC